MYASPGCGALSAKCAAGINISKWFSFLANGRDAGFFRHPFSENPLFLQRYICRLKAVKWMVAKLQGDESASVRRKVSGREVAG